MRRLIMTLVSVVLGLHSIASGSAQDANEERARPDLKLWATLKRSLTGDEGEEFFRQNVKDCVLPVLVGTLISAAPPEAPSVLVIALSDLSTPDITLHLKDDTGKDAHLNGPIMRGSQIRFQGAAMAFTKNPFMLTFETSPKFGRPRKR
jgi:hypothetical protein